MTTLERRCLRRAVRLVVVREVPVGARAADDVRAFVVVLVAAAATVADVVNCIQTRKCNGERCTEEDEQVHTSSNTSTRRRSPVSLSIQ